MIAVDDSLPAAFVVGTGLLLGLMLLAAVVGGFLAHTLRLPRVVGYLFAGAGLKFAISSLLEVEAGGGARSLAEAEEPLGIVKSLALGLILFSIGSVFEKRHLRRTRSWLARIGLLESGLTAVLVFFGVALAAWLSGVPASNTTILVFAALLGFAAIATAPAATLVTLREYEAKGSNTDTILSVVGLNNVICIVAFHAAFLLMVEAGLMPEARHGGGDIWLDLPLNLAGSVLLGLLGGFAISVAHARFRIAEAMLVLVGLLVLLGAGERVLLMHLGVSYNFLLTTICIGAVFANVAIDPDRMDSAIRTIGQPIFALFFVLAGYQLHFEDLTELHWIGAAYVVCRVAGKVIGVRLGLSWCGNPRELEPMLGAALLCQAAVVIGLADFVSQHWAHEWARDSFVTTVLGSIAIYEVIGPVLIKWLAVRSGEVKAVTLLRREGSGIGVVSVVRLTGGSLLRMFGLRVSGRAAGRSLYVRDVMRSNVKCIPADARFDEVLHMIEDSHYNHFPVIDSQEQLVGVLHYADIREIIYDPGLYDLVTAADLAAMDTRAVPIEMPLEELLPQFRKSDLASFPVVDKDGSKRVVGIIEQRDVLRVLQQRGDGRG